MPSHLKVRSLLGLLVYALAFFIFAASVHSEPLVKPGERMVFIGDGMTELGIYTRYVMNYFALRYPDATFSFRKIGMTWETAVYAVKRIDTDIMPLKPNVVIICYGMTDGGFAAFDQKTYEEFLKGMSELTSRLRASGVKVVILTPCPVDPEQTYYWKAFDGKVYNETLAKYSKGLKEFAAKESIPFFDIYSLMTDVSNSAKKENPKFTLNQEEIFPSESGMAIVAYGLIKAMNCDDEPASLEINAESGNVTAVKCDVGDLTLNPDKITFSRTDKSFPAYFDPRAKSALPYFPFDKELNSYVLKISGLSKGKWKLKVENLDVGVFYSEELNEGVNLANCPGPWQEIGKKVNEINKNIESCYCLKWKDVDIPFMRDENELVKQLKPEIAILDKKLESLLAGYEKSLVAALSNLKWKWELGKVGTDGR